MCDGPDPVREALQDRQVQALADIRTIAPGTTVGQQYGDWRFKHWTDETVIANSIVASSAYGSPIIGGYDEPRVYGVRLHVEL